MRPRNFRGSNRVLVLALVAGLHLGLLWLLMTGVASYPAARSVTTLVQLIMPEPIKPKLGAVLKSPVITRSEFALPTIAPPKIIVMIVQPSPMAPPAPVAVPSGASAPSSGDRTPPALPPDDFTAYLRRVHDFVQARCDQMAAARLSQRPGSLRVIMQIDRSGKILVWAIAASAHPKSLDYEIAALIRESNPLPPFPANIRAPYVITAVPVNFQEIDPPLP